MRFQAPRGTEDVLPDESAKWIHLESLFRKLSDLYGYQELRTPTFEDTDLFVRTSGESSDIVTKQMYTFQDKGDRSITLKPEGTAPSMRALIEHNLCPPGTVTRLSYVTPFFRYERPQKGRLREAHQFGLELIGSDSAVADAEIIEMAVRFYQSAGVPDVRASINSLGRADCRERYRTAILQHAESFLMDQTEEARARIAKNPLRLLDSKDPAAQEVVRSIPSIANYWEEDSRTRFERLSKILSDAGIPHSHSPEIVRGLDYYTETVFEIQSGHLGAQSALCGGGRYDNLISEIGGPPTPAVGVGMGVERCLIVLDLIGFRWPCAPAPIAVVSIGTEVFDEAMRIARELRTSGLKAHMDIDSRSMKAQMRQADKLGCRFVVLLGPDEAAKGEVLVKDLRSGEQVELARVGLIDWLEGEN